VESIQGETMEDRQLFERSELTLPKIDQATYPLDASPHGGTGRCKSTRNKFNFVTMMIFICIK